MQKRKLQIVGGAINSTIIFTFKWIDAAWTYITCFKLGWLQHFIFKTSSSGVSKIFIDKFHFLGLCWYFTPLAKMILSLWSVCNYKWWRFVPCFVSRSISLNTFTSHWYCLFPNLKTSFTLHICILKSSITGIKHCTITFWNGNAIHSIDEVRVVGQLSPQHLLTIILIYSFALTQAAIDVDINTYVKSVSIFDRLYIALYI